jgi:hypothetical protein
MHALRRIAMKKYRVMIWTSVDVEAESDDQAQEKASDMLIGGEINNGEFFIEPEEFFPSEYRESNE